MVWGLWMHRAISDGNIDDVAHIIVQQELATGGDHHQHQHYPDINTDMGYDSSGNAALHLACWHGHTDIVIMLLRDYSAQVDVRNARQKKTPLHLAATNKHAAVIRVLCDHGADVNAVDYGNWTPLHFACLCWFQRPNVEVISILLRQENIRVDAKDEEGSTPLHTLLRFFVKAEDNVDDDDSKNENSAMSIVKLLLEHGADPNTKLNDGTSALQTAIGRRQCSDCIAQLLLESGNDHDATRSELLLELIQSGKRPGLVHFLVQRYPHLRECKNKDGFLPVHETAMANHSLDMAFSFVRYQPLMLVHSYRRVD